MLLAATLLALSVSDPGAPAARDAHDADTVEIVNLLVKDFLGARGEAPDGEYVVVAAETLVLCPPDAGEEDAGFSIAASVQDPGLVPEVPESMRRALLCDQDAAMLPTASLENARVVLASQISAIFSGDGWWDDFYATFSGSRGYVQFSAVVYSEDGARALLYVSHSCGGLCGTGWLVSLSRQGGWWKVAARRMLWIS